MLITRVIDFLLLDKASSKQSDSFFIISKIKWSDEYFENKKVFIHKIQTKTQGKINSINKK